MTASCWLTAAVRRTLIPRTRQVAQPLTATLRSACAIDRKVRYGYVSVSCMGSSPRRMRGTHPPASRRPASEDPMTTPAHAAAARAAALTCVDVPRPEIELAPRPALERVLVG